MDTDRGMLYLSNAPLSTAHPLTSYFKDTLPPVQIHNGSYAIALILGHWVSHRNSLLQYNVKVEILYFFVLQQFATFSFILIFFFSYRPTHKVNLLLHVFSLH